MKAEPDRPPDASPSSWGILNESTRKKELILFCCLTTLLALSLLGSGLSFLFHGQAFLGFLPFVFFGTAAAVVGVVYTVLGAGILFVTWAMGRVFY